MTYLSIGLGNYVGAENVISIVSPESAPVKRMVQEAKDSNKCIDATFGRRTRSVIVMTTGQIVLSAIHPDTIVQRSFSKIKE